MARRVRVPKNFILSFVAPDDGAIGDPEKYQEYVRTGDEEFLKCTEEPAYYYFHPIPEALVIKCRALFSDESEEQAPELVSALWREVIESCLMGCKDHPIPVTMSKGKIVVNHVEWLPGTKAPEGLLDEVLKDDLLCGSAFNFLVSRVVLTEEQKN